MPDIDSFANRTRPPAIPVGHRLLHVGVPGTGTEDVTLAAASRRGELRSAGVCYPGRGVDHHDQTVALLGRRVGWTGAGDSAAGSVGGGWSGLLDELADRPRARGWLSDELLAGATDEQAQRLSAELGPELHVVVVVRAVADLLGPAWQYDVERGHGTAFEPWLRLVLGRPAGRAPTRRLGRRTDQGGVVQRWVDLLGADRVIAVVADPQRPAALLEGFAGLLDLPPELLAPVGPVERALSWSETELIRQLNHSMDRGHVRRGDYEVLVREGSVAELRRQRRPDLDEPPVVLPGWAVERAVEHSARHAASVRASGCRVVGDLAALTRPVAVQRTAPPLEHLVSMETAVLALTGMLSAATGRPVPLGSPSPVPGDLAGAGQLLHRAAEGVRRVLAPRRSWSSGVSGPASPVGRP